MQTPNIRVLIVAENASAKFGGEAALPLHYFRILRRRSIETWLIAHERTRDELTTLFPHDSDRIYFVPDTRLHRWLWHLNTLLPARLSSFTVGYVFTLLDQVIQSRLIRQVIRSHRVDVIHQPMPVSPKAPSMIFGLGVPVVIGPMNGGMNYPPGFQHLQSQMLNRAFELARLFSNVMNLLIPGKRQAAVLLVANQRTKNALPMGACKHVIEMIENGVDLSLWNPKHHGRSPSQDLEARSLRPPTRFVFIGRLVDWKAVDLLLLAFKRVVEQVPAHLEIIGDGVERQHLEQQAQGLGLLVSVDQHSRFEESDQPELAVQFVGWLSQEDCAKHLRQADALVLPSLYECGGAVVLEAMAMAMPAIATNWGGPADYLDASCGILVDPESPETLIEGLAAAMVKLAKFPELRQAMGKAARNRVVTHFDWEVKVDAMLKIYGEVVSSRSKRSSAANKSIVDGVIG